MILYPISKGSVNIYSIGDVKSSELKKFVEGLEERDQKQVVQQINLITHSGYPNNEQKFRNLGDGVWEIKTRNLIRIYSFKSNRRDLKNSLIITHGTKKRKQRQLSAEKKKVTELIDAFKECVLEFRKE